MLEPGGQTPHTFSHTIFLCYLHAWCPEKGFHELLNWVLPKFCASLRSAYTFYYFLFPLKFCPYIDIQITDKACFKIYIFIDIFSYRLYQRFVYINIRTEFQAPVLLLKIRDPGPWLCLHISEFMDLFALRTGKDNLSVLSMYEYLKKNVLNQSVYDFFFFIQFFVYIILSIRLECRKKLLRAFEFCLGLTKIFAPRYARRKHLLYSFHRRSLRDGQLGLSPSTFFTSERCVKR